MKPGLSAAAEFISDFADGFWPIVAHHYAKPGKGVQTSSSCVARNGISQPSVWINAGRNTISAHTNSFARLNLLGDSFVYLVFPFHCRPATQA